MKNTYNVTYPYYKPIGENSELDLSVIDTCNRLTLRTLGTITEGVEISPKRGNFKIIYKVKKINLRIKIK